MELKIDTEERADSTEIVAALENILSQPDFVASPRLSSFLRFVVTETLEGRADRLKAFTIASMALGHDEKFNPTTNSVVRVQAGRLRRLMELYYRGNGRFDRCEIRLRRGTYVPEFLFRSDEELAAQSSPAPVPETSAAPAAPTGEPAPAERPSRLGRVSWRLVKAAGLLVVAVGLGLGAWLWRAGAPPALFGHRAAVPAAASPWADASATISVDPIDGPRDDPAVRAFADDLETRLENALSRFDDPVVLHRSADGKPAAEPDYRLSGNLTPSGNGDISLAFRIWRPASGEIIWTRTFDALPLERTEAAFEPTVSALTAAVAQTYGVVFTDMRRRLSGRSDGFGCIILAYNYFKTPSAQAHAAARGCLEHSVAEHPDFAPGFAALAYLMVDTYLDGVDARPGENPLGVAIQMAQRAVDLAPQKARAHAATFLTRFFDKRFDDAFDSADRALALNPYATDTPARIGAAYVLRGNFDKGIPLLQRAVRFSPSPPGWYEFYFFLDAHMRGDEDCAFRHALRHRATQFPLGIVARIIVAHEQGDAAAVAQWSQRLEDTYPAFAADIPAAFDRYAMAPAIRTRLLADLNGTGFPLKDQ